MVTVTSRCLVCGRELGDARSMVVCGRAFSFGPTVCDACAAAREAEVQRNKPSRWERLCPKLYQYSNIRQVLKFSKLRYEDGQDQ